MTTLPANLPPRALSAEQAAEYCGIGRTLFEEHGPAPVKIGKRSVWLRDALDRWLDDLSGVTVQSAEQQALAAIHARRKDSVRHKAA